MDTEKEIKDLKEKYDRLEGVVVRVMDVLNNALNMSGELSKDVRLIREFTIGFSKDVAKRLKSTQNDTEAFSDTMKDVNEKLDELRKLLAIPKHNKGQKDQEYIG